MRIIIGAPVKGFTLKETLKEHLSKQGYTLIDVGIYDTERFAKYPSVGERVAYAWEIGRAHV
jgi:ribose 5-phosphate isomerase RpiB